MRPRTRWAKTGLLLGACGGLALAIATCGGGTGEAHKGHFSYGFETVSFTPCDSAEPWWVTGDADAMKSLTDQYQALVDSDYEAVYVELRGDASAPGGYGHLGAYEREFTLAEVVAIRLPDTYDCT